MHSTALCLAIFLCSLMLKFIDDNLDPYIRFLETVSWLAKYYSCWPGITFHLICQSWRTLIILRILSMLLFHFESRIIFHQWTSWLGEAGRPSGGNAVCVSRFELSASFYDPRSSFQPIKTSNTILDSI